MPKLHIYKNEKEACNAFAIWLTELIAETLKKQSRFTIALSAENIPKHLYKVLSVDFTEAVEWNKVSIFLSAKIFHNGILERRDIADAKNIPEKLPLPAAQIFSPADRLEPEDGALKYEESIRAYFQNSPIIFDLVILDIEERESSFTALTAQEENTNTEAPVISSYSKDEMLYKIALSSFVINASAVKAFVVTGKNKQDAVQHILKGKV